MTAGALLVAGVLSAVACGSSEEGTKGPLAATGATGGTASGGSAGSSTGGSSGGGSGATGGGGSGGTLSFDGGGDSSFQECATGTAQGVVTITRLPVDIVWMVDNSVSMRPAIEELTKGLNNFAEQIVAKGGDGLDYRIIMLALRADGAVPNPNGDGEVFGVCIPEPLAGPNCADGERYFQADINMRSTQLLEQFLGTLGQTDCYRDGDTSCGTTTTVQWGGPAWRQHLRDGATKTLVVVSDDDQRQASGGGMIGTWDFDTFEDFAGGLNPHNTDGSFKRALPPGILDSSWNGLFEGYTFNGIYGWGSESDDSVQCSSPDSNFPSKPGESYTHLVKKTGGVRAKICDGASAWNDFFDSISTAVEVAARTELACEIDIEAEDRDRIEPGLVNVTVTGPDGSVDLTKTQNGASDCGTDGGWYYDDEINPTQVILCPSTCDSENEQIERGETKVDIILGCETIIK